MQLYRVFLIIEAMTKFKAEKHSKPSIGFILLATCGSAVFYLDDRMSFWLWVFLCLTFLLVYIGVIYIYDRPPKQRGIKVFTRRRASSEMWINMPMLIALLIEDGDSRWLLPSGIFLLFVFPAVEYVINSLLKTQKIMLSEEGILIVEVFEYFYTWTWLRDNHSKIEYGRLIIDRSFWQRSKFDLSKFNDNSEVIAEIEVRLDKRIEPND